MNGTVKRVVPKKNFGFITGADGTEYFFHSQDFYGHWDDLETDVYDKGANTIHVEFVPLPHNPKGPRAENVKRLDHPNRGD